MVRMDPVYRMKERVKSAQKAKDAMGISPVNRAFDALATGVENVLGLNTGGPASGRIAKEKAIKKAGKKRVTTEKYAP